MPEESKNKIIKKNSTEQEKPPLSKRLLGWGIKGAILVAIVSFFGDLKDEQKESFISEVRNTELQKCGDDIACVKNLTAHFSDCSEDSIDSRRRGKYNRTYSLDQSNFDFCMMILAAVDRTEQTVALKAQDNN